MSSSQQDFTTQGFVKTYILPALLIFLVPVVSLLFFWHVQSSFDSDARSTTLEMIGKDRAVSSEDQAAAIAHFTKHAFSDLVMDPQFAAQVAPTTLFYFANFRWMIRLSLGSIVGGFVVLATTGICVWLSLRSQYAQYLCLLFGWHLLRFYGALQSIVIGVLVVELSFWVTAHWFGFYSDRLVLFVGILVLCSIGAVIKTIFTNPKNEFVVEGVILDRGMNPQLWHRLDAICQQVGAEPPNQVIAGIDDNFYVTEQPVIVDGHTYHGKSLFVSLALLKNLSLTEADAVMAHEMAHFSGDDTLYAQRISPLLARYEAYLHGLYHSVMRPVFYFMLCFRALFELSLRRIGREREFRADSIAKRTTSSDAVAGSLLRISAYSKFRQTVELELFGQERAMEVADVSHRIERGFPEFAKSFAASADLGATKSTHPFDSHPSLEQRLSAIGLMLNEHEATRLISSPTDGGWYELISNAMATEQEQWRRYEERFRKYHEESLAYRYLPSNDYERTIVEKSFPPRTFAGKLGSLSIDYEKIEYSQWLDALYYTDISRCELSDDGTLTLYFGRKGDRTRFVNLKRLAGGQSEPLDTFQRYFARYKHAVEYQSQLKSQIQATTNSTGANVDVNHEAPQAENSSSMEQP